MSLAFLNIGTQEMLVILVVILVLFGGKKLPELARGLGRGIREFKDASEDIKREISDQINNFEKDIKDIDVTVEDKPKVSTEAVNVEEVSSNETIATTQEEVIEQNNTEKKFPQFTPPENSVQHDPGAHPVDQTDYYKYGAEDSSSETTDTIQEDSSAEQVDKSSAQKG